MAVTLLLAGLALGYWAHIGWTSNFHTVVANEVYRSGNPSQAQLGNWHARYGIKTVVDLRGDGVNCSYPDEQRAVDRSGMHLEYVPLLASRLPSVAALVKLVNIIEESPRPILLHCEGGADRTGLASFIAAMAVGGQCYRQAEEQFSARYLHLETDKPIMGVLRQYREYCRANHADMGGWKEFRYWALNVYRG
jgi:protein tyrosine/serine phosphatase